jgi:methanogenic corrinoid protein MtbC1
VRDETDELGSMMLAQLLENAGVEALAIPVRRADEVLATVSAENPDVVFLSGMPPFAMARAHRLYRSLRAQNPQRKIMIGIWNYPDDVSRAAQKISRGEEIPIATTLAGALAQVRSYFGRTKEPSPEFAVETSPA